MVIKQLNIKNRTYYFLNDQTNIKTFNPTLLKLDKKSSISANIYYIGFVTNKPEYNFNSVNPLYLAKDQILKINGLVGEYDKDYTKIKFDSDNDLPLDTVLKFRILTIVIRCIFEKDGKYYPQIFLDDSLYEV